VTTFAQRMSVERADYRVALDDLDMADNELDARRKRLEIFEALAEIERRSPDVLVELVADLKELAR
jgi:hypothetical protein